MKKTAIIFWLMAFALNGNAQADFNYTVTANRCFLVAKPSLDTITVSTKIEIKKDGGLVVVSMADKQLQYGVQFMGVHPDQCSTLVYAVVGEYNKIMPDQYIFIDPFKPFIIITVPALTTYLFNQ